MKSSESEKALLDILDASRSEKFYEQLVLQALQYVPADLGSILTVHDIDTFHTKYSTEAMPGVTPRKRGFTYKTFISGQPKIISQEEMAKAQPILVDSGYRSFAAFPVNKKGVYYFASKKVHFFTSRYCDFLASYCMKSHALFDNYQMFTSLQESVENRDLFMAMAAHELKNPLTAVKIYYQILSAKLEKNQIPDSAWRQKFDKELNRVISLVHEYLDPQSTLEMQLNYTKIVCSLIDIINRAVENVSAAYPKHSFQVVNNAKQFDLSIEADENKILQVFTNILSNAAKFSEEKEHITVQLESKRGHFVIAIQDKGLGIHKDDLDKIFDKYYRGKNIQKDGMGIGLYLAKSIIQAHNGSIKVTSTYGKGTKFVLMLPGVSTQIG